MLSVQRLEFNVSDAIGHLWSCKYNRPVFVINSNGGSIHDLTHWVDVATIPALTLPISHTTPRVCRVFCAWIVGACACRQPERGVSDDTQYMGEHGGCTRSGFGGPG